MTPLQVFLHPRLAAHYIKNSKLSLEAQTIRANEARMAAAEACRNARRLSNLLQIALKDVDALSSQLHEANEKINHLQLLNEEMEEMKLSVEYANKNLAKVGKLKKKYEDQIKNLRKKLEAANSLLSKQNKNSIPQDDEIIDLSDDDFTTPQHSFRYSSPIRQQNKENNDSEPRPTQGDWLQDLPPL